MNFIKNIRLPTPYKISENSCWSIAIDQESIVRSIDPMPHSADIPGAENWHGDWLSPMALDLQMNGGLGVAFNELGFQNIPRISNLLDQLWLEGVDAICPTLVTCSLPQLRQSLEVLRQARQTTSEQSCKLLGAHLEGPFLSKDYVGAHDLKHLASPSLLALDERIRGYEREIALVTLAPELPGALELVKRLKDLGVVVSLGHSAADSEHSSLAFDTGVSMITHAFNAMPGIHHRFLGPLGEAISNGEIAIGLIADGVHVQPKVLQMVQKLAADKIVLVSDALSPYGISEEQYQWDERLLFIKDGVCRLENGTLVGTTIPLLETCLRMAKWTREPSASIWSSTISPRLALHHGNNIKEFLIGKSLKKLLRWKLDSDAKELTWEHAK